MPMTAGLIFVAFAVVALLLELSLLGSSFRDVATVADLAAEAGASVLVESGAYAGELSLDVARAEMEARRVGAMWGDGDEIISVDAEPGGICVTIADIYRPRTLLFIGVTELAVSSSGCAEPRSG